MFIIIDRVKQQEFKFIDTMRIGILTFHCAHNYGAVLQCYALQQAIKYLGHDVEVIDYRPNFLVKPYNIIYLKRLRAKSPLHTIKKCLDELLVLKKRIIRHNAFDSFINSKLILSERIKKFDKIPSKYDVYVMGSDQIWNPKITHGYDNAYFGNFNFTKGKRRYISYAASMESSATDKRAEEELARLLKNLDAISVRESQLADFLTRDLVSHVKVETVLDPTLIVDRQIWDKIAKSTLSDRRYVLIYQIRQDINTRRIATELARQLNATVVEITANFRAKGGTDILQCVSPEEFVGLIRDSTCVVTTSFHATSFSIIYNKPFYTLQLSDGNDSRAQSLLQSLLLSDRMINKESSPIFTDIDYKKIEVRIQKLKKDALDFLSTNI